jgi:hypothetical protein
MSAIKIERYGEESESQMVAIREVRWNMPGLYHESDVTVVIRTRDGQMYLLLDASTADKLMDAFKTALVSREKFAGSVYVEVE